MICPKCGMEYQDWVKECSDCHVPLVSPEQQGGEQAGLDAMHPVKLVSVPDQVQADLLEGLLTELGIPVLRKKLGSGGYMQAYMGFSIFGEEIYVDEADYERAKEALAVLEHEDGECRGDAAGGMDAADGGSRDEVAGGTDTADDNNRYDDGTDSETSRFRAGFAVKIAIFVIVGLFALGMAALLIEALAVLFRTI